MNKISLTENHAFFITVGILCLTLLLSGIRAEKENREALVDLQQVSELSAFVAKKRYREAESLLITLERKLSDDYRILWQMGISHYQAQRFSESEKYLKKARQINPLIILEPVYLLQYAQVLADLNRYEIALLYLEKFQQQAATEELRKEAVELMTVLREKVQDQKNCWPRKK